MPSTSSMCLDGSPKGIASHIPALHLRYRFIVKPRQQRSPLCLVYRFYSALISYTVNRSSLALFLDVYVYLHAERPVRSFVNIGEKADTDLEPNCSALNARGATSRREFDCSKFKEGQLSGAAGMLLGNI